MAGVFGAMRPKSPLDAGPDVIGYGNDAGQEMARMDAPRLWGAVPGSPTHAPFFGAGGTGGKIVDGLGAFANKWLALDGNQGAQEDLQQQRQMQQAAALRAQSLQDGRNTWLMEQQYKAANPTPPDLADRVDYLNKLTPGLGNTYANNYAATGGYPQMMEVPGVGLVAVPKGTGTPAAAPTAPVGKLTPIGGAGQVAPRTFR